MGEGASDRTTRSLGTEPNSCPGVVGERLTEQRHHFASLDHPTVAHHQHPVGQVGDHAHVVGDQQHGHAESLPQLAQQLQDLRLHTHVERRGRFVGDQQHRVVGQGQRDHHALLLATGELVGVRVDARLGLRDPDQGQQLDGTAARRATSDRAMGAERLGELPADRLDRVQRRLRLLEHHGRQPAPDPGPRIASRPAQPAGSAAGAPGARRGRRSAAPNRARWPRRAAARARHARSRSCRSRIPPPERGSRPGRSRTTPSPPPASDRSAPPAH